MADLNANQMHSIGITALNLQEKCWTSGCMNGGFSRPGTPTDNATVESFNGRLRQECLNENWFMSLEDALCKIEA